MARSTGKGVISFGMVNIPVKLFTTGNSSAKVSFRLLSKDGNKLKQQYIDPTTEQVVEREDMVKGYEYAKGQYVIFKQDEIKAFAEASSPNIAIEEFVPAESVPSTFISKSYYLTPDAGGLKAYGLLAQALTQTGKVGLARWAARGKQYLVMIAPYQDGLAFHQLHYEDEVTKFEDVRIAPDACTEPEVEMAKMLINQISKDRFQPERFTDSVKERLEQAIEAKLQGKELSIPEPEAPKTETVDLMAALKASLAASQAA